MKKKYFSQIWAQFFETEILEKENLSMLLVEYMEALSWDLTVMNFYAYVPLWFLLEHCVCYKLIHERVNSSWFPEDEKRVILSTAWRLVTGVFQHWFCQEDQPGIQKHSKQWWSFLKKYDLPTRNDDFDWAVYLKEVYKQLLLYLERNDIAPILLHKETYWADFMNGFVSDILTNSRGKDTFFQKIEWIVTNDPQCRYLSSLWLGSR